MSITPIDPLEKYIQTLRQSTNPQREADKANVTKAYNDQINTVQNLYSGEVNKAGQQYSDLERQNAVQKLINERAVAERAENLGLTDSGLNRTQQTAVQLSYANNQSKIARQKQAAIDSLNSQMNAKITELEGNKATALAGIDSQYEQSIHDNAVSARNTDVDSYNKLVESQNKALTERRNELIEAKKYILNYDGDKAEAIYNANVLYGFNESGEEFTQMLNLANMTDIEYETWWRENTAEGIADTEAKEKAKEYSLDFPNAGKQEYKFKVGKIKKKGNTITEDSTVYIWYCDDKNTVLTHGKDKNTPAAIQIKSLNPKAKQQVLDALSGKTKNDEFNLKIDLGQ